ncbi:uncharacterized protein LOC119664637 [Teleopsis dalmanni]|uniref:uncharacterized protein LOC119664637 n=1 Tax=Teleopsis dalmanni TaxID=139649 RepID=UPI0018CD61B4|nr:uncharacterized protein LOC119664637 [Teleopsis dalmanni]
MDCAEDINIVDDVASALEAMNYVNIVFDDTKCGRNITTTVLSLFDTGSAISLIHKSSVSVAIQEETDETQYYGLGKFEIKTYGKISCRMIFKNRCEKVFLFVVPDNTLPDPLLLGRDSLQKFQVGSVLFTDVMEKSKFVLCSATSDARARKQNEINPFENELRSLMADNIDTDSNSIDINPMLEKSKVEEIREVVLNYLNSHYEGRQENYEMNIKLTSDVPFYFAPRKLSFEECEALQKIISDLLKKEIITPSDSLYASAIVMVRKKNEEFRKCVDYRVLNKNIIRDNYPLTLIETCLEYLKT